MRAARLDVPWCNRSGSATCSPMRRVGFKAVIESWNTIAMSLPRRARYRSAGSPTSSVPPKSIEPPVTRPPSGSMPITARPVMDLPDPVSPTIPRVSPRSSARSTPETGWTIRPPRRISTDRSRIVSTRLPSTGSRAFSKPSLARTIWLSISSTVRRF